MKKILTALVIISVLIGAGCTTSSDMQSSAGGSSVGEVKEKTPVTEIVNVGYLIKETSFFSDGYVESYKVFTLNEDGTVAREDLFDSFDEIIESVVYEEQSSAELKRSLYNARGELQSWKMIMNNPDGSIRRMESYSADNNLQTASEYTYDENGNKLSWSVSDSDDVVLSVTKYNYENGLNTKIEIYDTAMKLREYFLLEYDGDKLISNSHFDVDGTLNSKIEYLYISGRLIQENQLRANGSVSIMIKYTNDENGNPVKIEYFDGNGKLKDWIEKEYEYVQEEITVWN